MSFHGKQSTVNFAKYKQQRIHSYFQSYYPNASKPVWLQSVLSYPPACPTHNLPQIVSLATETPKSAFDYCKGTKKWNQYYSKHDNGCTKAKLKKAVAQACRMSYFPKELTFPEDSIRARFFQDHPLEKHVPMSMFEHDAAPKDLRKPLHTVLETMWGASRSRGARQESVMEVKSAQDVAVYTCRLMESGMTEDVAYETACDAFYETIKTAKQESITAQNIARAASAHSIQTSDLDEIEREGTAVIPPRMSAIDQWIELEQKAVANGLTEMQLQREKERLKQMSKKSSASI